LRTISLTFFFEAMSSNTNNSASAATTKSAPPATAKSAPLPAAAATDGQIERFYCSLCMMGYSVPPGWPAATCTRCGHKVCNQCLTYTRLTDETIGADGAKEDNFARAWWNGKF
jgi:hypothetical protein